MAYVTDNEDRAIQAVTGGSHDKGVDALFIDDPAHAVFLIQAKYRNYIPPFNYLRHKKRIMDPG
jgi:hypothetical protein